MKKLDELDKQEVKVVLDKFEERSKKARMMSLAITGIAILIGAAVLSYMYYLINASYQMSKYLDKRVAEKQEELNQINKELKAKRAELATALNEAEKFEEIKNVFEDSKSSSQKIREVTKIIEQNEIPVQTPTPIDQTPIQVPVNRIKSAKTITSNINVRAEPNLKAEVMGTLGKDEKVRVIEYSKNKSTWGGTTANWVKIKTRDGTEGFVFSPLLEIIE